MSGPSSPPRDATLFYSAPASPTRISPLYNEFNWEEIPKEKHNPDEDDEIFSFDFSGKLERILLSTADELFDCGNIKPLKPPPRFQYEGKHMDSSKSPKILFMETFSPRHKKKDFDAFVTALQKQSRTEKPHQNSSNLSPLKISNLLFDHESNQENTKKSAFVSSSSSSSSSSFSSSSVSSMNSLWSKK
uniref:Calmodulin-binding protein n=1 Tax=Solanum tuberosum TaxID=4113 RepID=M1DXQ6_SOLTU